jgi:hypothetical protein
MSESKSPARTFSTAEATSASTTPTSDNNTPNTKESLAWFRSRHAQWKGSSRRKMQAYPSLLPLYTPSKPVTKERTVTATDTSTSVSIRQQPMSQPHFMKCAAVIPPASSSPPAPAPAPISLDGASFAPTTTSPRQSLNPSTTTTFKQRQHQQERNDDTATTTTTAAAAAATATVHVLLVILLRNATARSAAATKTAAAAASNTRSSLPVSTENSPIAFGASGGSGE